MKIAHIMLAFSLLLISACSIKPAVTSATKDEYPIREPTLSTTRRTYQSVDGMQLAQALAKKDNATASRLLEESGNKLANTKYRSKGCFHHKEEGVIFLTLKNPEMLAMLLDYGADIESRNRDGQTPLLNATSYALPQTVALLIKKGANPNAVLTIEATRTCDWNGKQHICKDMPEQKLTALDIARHNLKAYTKSKILAEQEQKIHDYNHIIKILEPITEQSKSQTR
ncbi:hypothetical protein GC177_05640 [bacterium]|nr:hypothetical protein [bacterium]